jgi:transcriptional regulator with XRE-family HTH domain
VDKSTISRILRGKRYPRRATVEAIRKATDNRVTVADLYYTEAT